MGMYLVLLALAKLASSSWVSLSLFLLVCSEVLTDTDVSLQLKLNHNEWFIAMMKADPNKK